jgi:hypothetical protein
MLICHSLTERVAMSIVSVAMIATGIILFYRASKGKVIGFAAAIGHERVIWTRIVAAVLCVIGAMLLISVVLRLDC